MKLSVIIPTYNRAHTLIEAIDSVLGQSLQDLELIVVDDGSTDETPEAVRPYRNDLTYIQVENGGIPSARNVGMRMAKGRYIAYLDDDDLYYPFKSELQSRILDNNPQVGMVYSEFSAFSDQGYFDEYHIMKYHESAYQRGGVDYAGLFDTSRQIEECDYIQSMEALPDRYRKGHSLYSGHIYDAYLMNTVVFTNSMMFRRDVLDRVGYQETSAGLFHDLEFALRICKAYRVAFVDIPTYRLRYHRQQVSTLNRADGNLVAIKKQRDLFFVTRRHAMQDVGYYEGRKQSIDRQFARLARAVALPMLTVSKVSKHKLKYYPRRARAYLRYSTRCGYPQRVLLVLTYIPSILRRVVFRLLGPGRLGRV